MSRLMYISNLGKQIQYSGGYMRIILNTGSMW